MDLSKFQTQIMLFVVVVSSGFGPSARAQGKPHSVEPAASLVPDAKTAIQRVETFWNRARKEKDIPKIKAFKVSLSRGVWLVEGKMPRNYTGGHAATQIRRRDGRILSTIVLQ